MRTNVTAVEKKLSSALQIKQRVNRIIGQLKGIEKMAENKRDCDEIIQQVAAVKKAIDSLTREVVVSDVIQYIPPIRQKEIIRMIDRAISL
jgi:DNA-binding FrmR family transcriptional regulator